jgi:hypothetical protein
MFKIENLEFADLDAAMDHAKTLNRFVTISGNGFEVCGIFGVDSIKNRMTPDGHAYEWDKSARIGKVRKNDKISVDRNS